jgi:CDP-diglyceride synthetase
MLHYSEHWSTAMILLAVVAFAAGPSALGLLIVRRRWRAADLHPGHDVVGFAFGVVGLIYGVMLGFVLSAIWGQYTHTDEVATLEGVSLRNLHRNSYALPATNQVAIRAALIAHAHAVVEDEWQSLRYRQESQLAQDTMERVWQSYYAVNPETDAQKAWLAESIHTLNEMAKLRRVRILAADQTVSGVMWVLLLFGAVATCGFMHAFGVERFRAHLLMTATVAVLILLILYMIYALDNPFGGEPHLTPEAFIRFLKAHPTPE